MNRTEQQIELYLLPFSKGISKLAQELRQFIKQELNPSLELVGDSTISLNIGYGFTEKAWDCFCAIIVYSKHINISFPSGADLSDPNSLLQGKGSRVRHIRVESLDDLNAKEVLSLLNESRKNAWIKVEHLHSDTFEMNTLIKNISGPKKRRK